MLVAAQVDVVGHAIDLARRGVAADSGRLLAHEVIRRMQRREGRDNRIRDRLAAPQGC